MFFAHERDGAPLLLCMRVKGYRVLYLCLCQSGQEGDEDDVAVDDQDFLNEDELAELQRDEENIRKEVCMIGVLSLAVHHNKHSAARGQSRVARNDYGFEVSRCT